MTEIPADPAQAASEAVENWARTAPARPPGPFADLEWLLDMPIEARREAFGWFGEEWWGWTCYDFNGRLIEEMRKPFPVGESCLYCGEPFDEAAGDSGQAVPCVTTDGASIRHVHKECQLRSVSGGIAHHEGRCSCHGGTTETPGMTLRQESVEVWRRMRAGELFGKNR